MAKRDLQKRIDLPGATLTSSAIRVSGSGGGGGMAAHALFGPYHTGELDRTQATWVATDIATAIATHTAIEDAHHAKQHSVTDAAHHTVTGAQYSVVGLSALNTLGVLPSASDVSAAANTLLRSDSLGGIAVSKARTPTIDTASGGLSIAPANGTTTITGTTVVTVGVQTPLITTASGNLSLTSVGGTVAVTGALTGNSTATFATSLTVPLIDTASGNLVIQPAGDLVLNPGGNDVLPSLNYDINLGALSKKYLTLHAAELWVETLVAQETIATIGGRILVGPTTTLEADLSNVATSIVIKHNNLNSGDRIYMEAAGKVEFMAVTSGYSGTGPYTYSVTRNLDGSGANQWYAGDAVLNTGQAGNGFIDLYSLYGIPRNGQTATNRAGPTIVGNVRLSSTYNDFRERWAVGSLNGLYDYATEVYGFAAGDPTAAWVGLDATNGLRMMSNATKRMEITPAGTLNINNSGGAAVITLDNSGNSYFAGVMTIGASGEIRQGTGTLLGNYTGLRIWRDTNVGRIGGYNSNTMQWYADTDGKLYAGAGAIWLDALGANFAVEAVGANPRNIRFMSGSTLKGSIGYFYTAGPIPTANDGMIFYNGDSTKFRFLGATSTEFSATVNVTGYVTATSGMSVSGDIDMNGNDIIDISSLTVAPPAGTSGLTLTTPANQNAGMIYVAPANCGSSFGPHINIGRNSNASTPAAGFLYLVARTGVGVALWVDNGGTLRLNAGALPTNANDTSGTVVGSQSSWIGIKKDITPWHDTKGALSAVLQAPLYNYRLRADDTVQYRGLVITEEDRANHIWYAENMAENQLPALNERNLFGYLIASIKEQQAQIEALEERIKELTRQQPHA